MYVNILKYEHMRGNWLLQWNGDKNRDKMDRMLYICNLSTGSELLLVKSYFNSRWRDRSMTVRISKTITNIKKYIPLLERLFDL